MDSLPFGRSLWRAFKDFCIVVEARPRILCHRHREVLADGELAPHEEAPRRWEGEVIPTPNNLILADPRQLVKVFLLRGDVPVPDVLAKDTPLFFLLPRRPLAASPRCRYGSGQTDRRSDRRLIRDILLVHRVARLSLSLST